MSLDSAAAAARAAVESMRDDGIRLLRELVAIESVSAPAPDEEALVASAHATAAAFRAAGIEDARVVGPPDAPAVIGERLGADGAPTVLLYGHHDVQSAEAPEWRTPPFDATPREGRLYGRGAADDKGGLVAHWLALKALDRVGEPWPVNVRLMLEGEEERGSPTLPNLLAEHTDELRADVVLVVDMVNPAPGQPSLTTSLRGIVDLDVTVRIGSRPVHSGMFGGLLPDAILVLSRLLASLHAPDGSLAVEGLGGPPGDAPDAGAAATVRDAGGASRESPDGAPAAVVCEDEAAVATLRDAGAVEGLHLLGGGSVHERIETSAINVLGLAAPAPESATHQIVPTATARLSLRLEAGRSPDDALAALRRHLEANVPWGAELEIRPVGLVPGCSAARDGATATAAGSALAAAFGVVDVPRIPQGGGIPACAALAEAFPACELVLMGVADPDSAIHGPDESVSIDTIVSMATSELLLMRDLPKPSRRPT